MERIYYQENDYGIKWPSVKWSFLVNRTHWRLHYKFSYQDLQLPYINWFYMPIQYITECLHLFSHLKCTRPIMYQQGKGMPFTRLLAFENNHALPFGSTSNPAVIPPLQIQYCLYAAPTSLPTINERAFKRAPAVRQLQLRLALLR